MNAVDNLILLTKMQFASMRWFWRSILISNFVVPGFLMLFWKLADVQQPAENMVHFLAGNLVVGLLFGNMNRVASRFIFLRETDALDYYATLLVNKTLLIFAVTLVFLLVSLPGAVAALIVGTLLLDVPISPHPLLIVAILPGSMALSVLGAALGVYGRTMEEVSTRSQLLAFALMILSPVLIPVEQLPLPLQWTSVLVPTTYAASALRMAMVSDIGTAFWVNIGVLLAFSALAFWLVHRRLEWRA